MIAGRAGRVALLALALFTVVEVLLTPGMPPQEAELKRLVKLFEDAREALSKDERKANQLATMPIGPVPAGMNVAEVAAWTVVGNVILNLDETLMKR